MLRELESQTVKVLQHTYPDLPQQINSAWCCRQAVWGHTVHACGADRLHRVHQVPRLTLGLVMWYVCASGRLGGRGMCLRRLGKSTDCCQDPYDMSICGKCCLAMQRWPSNLLADLSRLQEELKVPADNGGDIQVI